MAWQGCEQHLKGTRFKAFFAELKIAGRVANWKGMYARPTIPVNSWDE